MPTRLHIWRLEPQTDEQRSQQRRALDIAESIVQTRWLIFEDSLQSDLGLHETADFSLRITPAQVTVRDLRLEPLLPARIGELMDNAKLEGGTVSEYAPRLHGVVPTGRRQRDGRDRPRGA